MRKHKLLVTVIIILLGIFVVFGLYSHYSKQVNHIEKDVSEPGLILWEVNYVKNVHGEPVWSLRVKQALKDEKTGVLKGKGIKLTLFKKGKELLYLKADKGEADIKKGKFRVWDNVLIQIKDSNCFISSKEIQYDENEKRLSTPDDVSFNCDQLKLKGHGLSVDLKTRLIKINGTVEGFLK